MITVISGTNRQDSVTIKVSALYKKFIEELFDDVHLLSLEGKNVWERSSDLKEIEDKYLAPAQKFVFILPEYNGSFPGILKLMMDNSDIKRCWWYKKAMLVGVADGRGGNLRGVDQMTNVLNYLKINVLYNKILLSRVKDEVDASGMLLKPATLSAIHFQIDEFLKF